MLLTNYQQSNIKNSKNRPLNRPLLVTGKKEELGRPKKGD